MKVYIKRDLEIIAEVKMTSKGYPAHMGSLSYPGHPAEGPEFEVTSVETADGTPLSEYEKECAIDAALEKAYEQGEA